MDITQSKDTRIEHVEVDDKGVGPDFRGNAKFLSDAAQATANEHNLGLVAALKTHRKAAIWSVRKLASSPFQLYSLTQTPRSQ